ncbi:hypothetical protein KKC97_09930 [bacterium]|nr:hypothetical protein [bacterium]MBU1637970.1 hypothetical protein [bacterium]MBU1920932.1 hypothetical protein [bacterium]
MMILPVMLGGFRVLSPFIHKIGTGLQDRQGLIDRVAAFRKKTASRPVLLFHCASAGEFESLRPLAKELDRNRFALAVSYFSPSARAATEKSNEFDFIDCSPSDDPAIVNAYLDALRPCAVCITKHDVWPNFIWQSERRGIPRFLISGNFHARSLKMLPGARGFHRAVYRSFTEIMTVSESDSRRAAKLCGSDKNIVTIGDSRYDQVRIRSERPVEFQKEIIDFCKGKTVLIIGSSHTDDENLILPLLKKLMDRFPELSTVIVPHDPSKAASGRISSTAREFGLSVADLDLAPVKNQQLLIINRTGILADLYRLGSLAYVGGGFGKGVHSVLEPMIHGLPVITGPNINVSNEALQARTEELLVTVTGRNQASDVLSAWLSNSQSLLTLQKRARQFVLDRCGATKEIARRIQHGLA